MSDVKQFTYLDLSIAYRTEGQGKPLVILHGWGTDGRVMMPLAKRLGDVRRCYVPDLPGFGESDTPSEAWSIDDYADLIQAFTSFLDNDQVDFLVHSFGGRILLKLCSRPFGREKVEKALITGGAGMKPHRDLTYYCKRAAVKALKAPFYLLPENTRDYALSKLRKTRVWKALGSSDYQMLDGVMREIFVLSVTEFLEPCLPNIHNEVLLLWGRNDEATPLYQAERLKNGIRNAELVVIDHAGHYAFLDRPNHFTAIAKAFFKDR